jgi:ribosomal protein S18 acetylase RimI-like enzyme
VVTGHFVDDPASVVGFYAMSIQLEKEIELGSRHAAGSKGQSGSFATVQLWSVAVQKPLQRQGYGTVLMGAALRDFYEIVIRTGIFSMTLQAANAEVAKFYEKLGFTRYGYLSELAMPKMILPAQAVIDIIGNRKA